MQVHAEYTLYGHFLHLRELLGHAGKIRFFLDQDSGMRAACLGSFADRIKARDCDAFYVRIAKETTVDEKRRLLRDAQATFAREAAKRPGLTENEVKLVLLKARIAAAQSIGQWKDRWVMHPLPSMAEPEKALCYLTDMCDYDPDHLASRGSSARRACTRWIRGSTDCAGVRPCWSGPSPPPATIPTRSDVVRIALEHYLKKGAGRK